MLLNGQERAIANVGRSLPRLVLATIAPAATCQQVSVSSDGDEEAPCVAVNRRVAGSNPA
jgi:hypothetical protein